MVLPAIKRTRNAAASALAAVLFHAPALERPYRGLAGACRDVPGVRTFFREATDRLCRQLAGAGREFRSVRIGPVTPWLDVTHFAVAGRHFADVPYEPGATGVLLSALHAGSVFVDIGANAGYFSVIAGLLVGPTGRVVAFEPNPDARARLERHLELNHLIDRTTVSSYALGDRDQEDVDFYISCSPENSGLSSLIPAEALLRNGALRTDARLRVPLRTFDNVADGLGLRAIDLVKIDVEGAEHAVLSGMSKTLATTPPIRIICETAWGSDAHQYLAGFGYRVRMLDEVPGGTPNLLFERDPHVILSKRGTGTA